MLLKYLNKFWRPLGFSEGNRVTTFAITGRKLYVFIVTLLTQNNAKLLQWLKSGYKRTINWNKYQSKLTTENQNEYLNYLINPSFLGVNRLFFICMS